MFTLRSTRFPRILMRGSDASLWPFDTRDRNQGTSSVPHLVDHVQQERVLAPLLGFVAKQGLGEYHIIAAFMRIKAQQIIDLASSEKVSIGGNDTTILQILADSTLHHTIGYSVVGHEQNEALQNFVRQKLSNVFNLKQL